MMHILYFPFSVLKNNNFDSFFGWFVLQNFVLCIQILIYVPSDW